MVNPVTPDGEDYTTYEYILRIDVLGDEPTPEITELIKAVYQSIKCIDTQDAIDVESLTDGQSKVDEEREVERRVCRVPSQSAREADLDANNYAGFSNDIRAAFGKAAVDVGAADESSDYEGIIDTLANIAHYAERLDLKARELFRIALEHAVAE